jgi:hypothetical protein
VRPALGGHAAGVFVSAADRALDGTTQANRKAGAVFNRQFGEVCHVESVSG